MHLTMKLQLMVRKEVSHVELVKDERHSFGITFTDGTGDQEGPVIKNVKPKSLAERCHAVCEGDVLLSINGREVMGMRCKNIQRMIRENGSKVDLKLQYRTRETHISRSNIFRKERMTTKLQKVGDSFGFVLRKRDSKYSFTAEFPVISNIKQGGPAHMDGLIQDGDRLLKIDNVSLSWLSLAEVAAILMAKREAKFTFEYNVREVDFPQSLDRVIALDIDLPSMDLGIGLCVHSEKSCGMCIGSIRMGSVAERWGVFSLGDIILSVNDIDVEFLTVSKANSMLQRGSKIRKISFISTKMRELHVPISLGKSICHHKDKFATTSGSSIDVLGTEKKHLNTPASTNTTISVPHNIQTREVCRREQVKAIKKFYDMLKHTTDLKQNLSQMTNKAFEDNNMLKGSENCTACNKTQHSVKLCASCISKVNVKCAQSMDLLRNLVAHFVKMSLKQENFLPTDSDAQTTNVRNHIREAVFENLIFSLTETLPKVFNGKLELQESFQALAQEINKADASCDSCKNKINSASLTVQRLLLLISLSNPNAEIKVLINQLVYCLLETRLTCEEDTDSSESSLEENSVTESENDRQHRLLPSREEQSDSEIENVPPNVETSESDETNADSDQNTLGSISKTPRLSVNLNQQSAYFKLTDIQSVSESDSSSNDLNEAAGFNIDLPHGTPLGESSGASAASLEPNLLDNSKMSNVSKDSIKIGTIYKDKGLLNTPVKVWRSLETVLSPNKSPRVRSAARNELHENPKPCETKSSNEVVVECSFMDPPQSSTALDAKHITQMTKRNGSESNHESMESSKDQTENEKERKKTHTETIQVNMLNEGEGFGFVLGFSSPNFSDTLPVPIITTVKHKSPAHKTGILAKNDRVLAINSQSIVGIPLKDLENLKRRIFSSDHITLNIEFDVVDTPMKFGTFNVVLDKTLKVGLLFEDLEKGSPMIVSGVVKGSASHRSGKVFPGDKVTFLKCVRNEEFNPITCDYTREETVKIAVQRDSGEGKKESPIPSNPFSYNEDSKRRGANFIVKHTSVRSAGGNDTLVLDQEVTLFRDPISWDFGFLVGENPDTGRAYIIDVRPNGPASSSGVIKKFDRIVEVNGVAVGKNEACSVLSFLTQANDKMDMLIRRLYCENVDDASQKLHPFKPTSFL